MVFLGAVHLDKMRQELRDMVEDPPMPKSPPPPVNNSMLNESMDDDSKDHGDLGELEGKPAELNITAQHEEEASVQQQVDSSGLGSRAAWDQKGEGGGVGVDEVSDSVSNRVAVGGVEGDETPEAKSSTPTGSTKMESD